MRHNINYSTLTIFLNKVYQFKVGIYLWISFGLVLATARFAHNLDRLRGLKVRDPSWLCLKSYLA